MTHTADVTKASLQTITLQIKLHTAACVLENNTYRNWKIVVFGF